MGSNVARASGVPVPSSVPLALCLAISVDHCPPAELTELRLLALSWIQGLKKPVKLLLGIAGRILPLLLHFICSCRAAPHSISTSPTAEKN